MDPEQPSASGGREVGSARQEAAPGGTQQTLVGETRKWPAAAARKKEGGRRIKPPALFARFPRLIWRRPVGGRWDGDWPVVRSEHVAAFPALEGDLKLWLDQFEPRFRALDHRAQMLENQFWRQNVALIVGGLVATTLGAIQAAVGGGVAGLAGAQAALAGVLAGLAVLVRSRRTQYGYLTARLKAERIKSEFFVFLARAGDYAGGDPRARLRQQVDEIEAAEGMT